MPRNSTLSNSARRMRLCDQQLRSQQLHLAHTVVACGSLRELDEDSRIARPLQRVYSRGNTIAATAPTPLIYLNRKRAINLARNGAGPQHACNEPSLTRSCIHASLNRWLLNALLIDNKANFRKWLLNVRGWLIENKWDSFDDECVGNWKSCWVRFDRKWERRKE